MFRFSTISCAVIASMLALGGSANAGPPVFRLNSTDLQQGSFKQQQLLNGFGCNGENISPALEWSGVPAGTRSLALIVHDEDAPTGSGFWHWAVYDIPADATGLARGAGNAAANLPAGARAGSNDFQDTGVNGANGNYGGPCPPAGDAPHHYVFSLYALAVDKIAVAAGIPTGGTPALYGFVLNRGLGAAVLGSASFTATYARPR